MRFGSRALVVVAVAVTVVASMTPAGAQTSPLPLPEPLADPSASDSRATFVGGNAKVCADVGFPSSIKLGPGDNSSTADAYVSGTVATNAGPVEPGEGEELNVAILSPGVVVDAVVVKGGPAHNIYSDAAVLPPSLLAPQHYISPFNGGGNIPEISHWFVCYHVDTPLPTGSLTVQKAVVSPDGRPVDPLPTAFDALVNCNDGVNVNVPVSFARGGGRASTGPTISGIAIGTTCTVVELNSGSFPPGSSVTYEPTGADVTGVLIDGPDGVVVSIINDFSGVAVQTAPITVTKTVVPVDGVSVPASFTVNIRCDDGTDTDVVVPGAGGTGVPVVDARVLSACFVEELAASIPAGWTVTYSLNGGPPSPTAPTFNLLDTTAVVVAVTNDPTDAVVGGGGTDPDPAPAPDPDTGPDPDTDPGVEVEADSDALEPETLPATGAVDLRLLAIGLGSLVTGTAILCTRARRAATTTLR